MFHFSAAAQLLLLLKTPRYITSSRVSNLRAFLDHPFTGGPTDWITLGRAGPIINRTKTTDVLHSFIILGTNRDC